MLVTEGTQATYFNVSRAVALQGWIVSGFAICPGLALAVCAPTGSEAEASLVNVGTVCHGFWPLCKTGFENMGGWASR